MTTPEKPKKHIRTLEEKLRDSRIETAQIAAAIAFKAVKDAIDDGDAIGARARLTKLDEALGEQIRAESDKPENEEAALERACATKVEVTSDAD